MPLVYGVEGAEKMSVVIGRFLKPYLDDTESQEEYEDVLAMGILIWNASLLPDRERGKLLKKMVRQVPRFERDSFKQFVDELLTRKRLLFDGNKRMILNFSVEDAGDSYHISVISTLPGETL